MNYLMNDLCDYTMEKVAAEFLGSYMKYLEDGQGSEEKTAMLNDLVDYAMEKEAGVVKNIFFGRYRRGPHVGRNRYDVAKEKVQALKPRDEYGKPNKNLKGLSPEDIEKLKKERAEAIFDASTRPAGWLTASPGIGLTLRGAKYIYDDVNHPEKK